MELLRRVGFVLHVDLDIEECSSGMDEAHTNDVDDLFEFRGDDKAPVGCGLVGGWLARRGS